MPVQVTRKGSEIVVVISETNVAAATEVEIPLGITRGRLLRVIADKTAGSASTLASLLGIATNPAGSNIVFEATAAATVDSQIVGGATFSTSGGSLFYRAKPDSGSDNSVTTILHILVGW